MRRSGLMTKFDRRTAANLEVALETVCRKLRSGGDHETRKRVAEAFLRAAGSGHTNLGELESVGRRALREAIADRPDAMASFALGPASERCRSRRQTSGGSMTVAVRWLLMNGFGARCSRRDGHAGSVDRPKPAASETARCLVPGGGPASFRSLHDGVALGRAQVPPARPAALSQTDFEKRELLRHLSSVFRT
jgi:hypothetical protein